MCSISGSFDSGKLRELVELNLYRGQHSWSYSFYDPEDKVLTVSRGLGELDLDSINIPPGCYGICHTQAPTTEKKGSDSIHPALYNDGDKLHALWHNGIIKDREVKRLQLELIAAEEKWDTALLLKHTAIYGTPKDIDGTFSCLWYQPMHYSYGKGNLILFRNEISPMFCDDDLNISSTKFEGSKPTPPNTMLYMDFYDRVLRPEDTFTTVENPYFFGV